MFRLQITVGSLQNNLTVMLFDQKTRKWASKLVIYLIRKQQQRLSFQDLSAEPQVNKNENFSRPAAQGGLHRDSQGFTWIIPEGLIHWVSLISEFCTFYEKIKVLKSKSFFSKKVPS